MTRRTENLIGALGRDLKPVKRLPPAGWRAVMWLGIVGFLAAIFVAVAANMGMFMRRVADPNLALEVVGTFLTGILAVFAAFQLSLPDRSSRWALLPLPSLLLWIGSSSYTCWRHLIKFGPDGWEMGESAGCLAWIVAFSFPLALTLLALLRQAKPLTPFRVAAMGGLGVASISAFLLQFFHPFDVTFMDLGLHLGGVAIVVIAATVTAQHDPADPRAQAG